VTNAWARTHSDLKQSCVCVCMRGGGVGNAYQEVDVKGQRVLRLVIWMSEVNIILGGMVFCTGHW
jgi:hypothetical protein